MSTKRTKLKALRHDKGLSQVDLAEAIGVSRESISLWERGMADPHPHYVKKLCTFFEKEASELGLHVIQKETDQENRRAFLQALGYVGLTSSFGSFDCLSGDDNSLSLPLSLESLHNLAVITQQFREMHRRGDTLFRAGLYTHIKTIQDALTRTTEDGMRRELWGLLAKTQLLARLGPAKKQEIAQKRTWNELAIVYAQQSSDPALTGGMIGHLAQFYLRQEPNTAKAISYLSEAQQHASKNKALMGWLSLLQASLHAKASHVQQCESNLEDAIDIACALPLSPEYSDVYYTDFSLISAQIFGINCWLTIGNPQKAHACFIKSNLVDLSEHRKASAFYDASRLYATLGDFGLMQTYAFQAIDKAIETHQLSVIFRCRDFATTLLKREKHAATAIVDYVESIQ